MHIRSTALVAVVLSVWAGGPDSRGQNVYDWLPSEGVPGLDGPAHALTTWDPDGPGPLPDRLVVSGSFTAAGGLKAGGIACWDGMNWLTLGTGMNGKVCALTVFNGQLIAGGQFTTAGGVTANCIARWDGTTWQPLGGGLGGEKAYVNTLTSWNGRLVATGYFRTAGGMSAEGVACWDEKAWQPLGGAENRDRVGRVVAATVYSGELIAFGDMYRGLFRWDGTRWHAIATGISNQNYDRLPSALIDWNGLLVVGGRFTSGSVKARDIAVWDGTNLRALGAGNVCSVRALALYNGTPVAGCTFRTKSGGIAIGVVRFNGAEWEPLADGPGNVDALAVYRGDLIAAGGFTAAGGVNTKYIARFDGTRWLPLGRGLDGAVHALTIYQGELIAGGMFTVAGGIGVNGIARWNGRAWQPLGSGVGWGDRGHGGIVFALTVYNGELIAGGSFTSAGDASASRIARWDGTTWRPLGSGMGGDPPDRPPVVFALTVHNGELIAGGDFATAGGAGAIDIARWDGADWKPLGTGVGGGVFGAMHDVLALSVYRGELIAGGLFTTAGGVHVGFIARWNGTGWQPLGAGMTGGVVGAMTVYQGELIAAGGFDTAGGVDAKSVARWDGSKWQPMGLSGRSMDTFVGALTVYDNALVASGAFPSGGEHTNRVARWNGTAWMLLGNGMSGVDHPRVRALTVCDGELIAGGDFTAVSNRPSAYWARWGIVGHDNGKEDDRRSGGNCPTTAKTN